MWLSQDNTLMVTVDATDRRPATVPDTGQRWFGAGARLWDITEPTQPRELTTLPGSSILTVVFGHDRRDLYTAGTEATLWDLTNPRAPRVTARLDLPTDEQKLGAAFGQGDAYLVVGDTTGRITRWKGLPRTPSVQIGQSSRDRTRSSRQLDAHVLAGVLISMPGVRNQGPQLASCSRTV